MPKLRELLENPPPARGTTEAQIEEMRNYLIRIVEELQYLLTHLESDNTNSTLWDDIDSQIPKAGNMTPLMDGAGSAGSSSKWSRENHRHPADSTKADVTDLNAHKNDHTNPHQVDRAQVGLGNVDNVQQYSASNPPPIPTPAQVGAIPASDKGSAGGVAELDANGMVPSAQLPSYVDDVLEYASLSAFPATGETGKIYVALDTNKTYRWSGSAYVEISESLALGETSSTAYRGDRGKTAYDHSQVASGNPHNVSAFDVGLGNVANERQYSALNPPPLPTPADIGAATAQDLTDHVGDTANPHGVTAAQVGARPDTWTPTASDVGARPDDWVPDADDVPYDNTGSGLMATDVQAAIDEIAQGGGGGGTAASTVSYDNTDSGLTATNVQDAIDEVYGDIPAAPVTIQRRWYGECNSADNAATREVSIPGIDALETGLVITVLMVQAQNYNGSPTLNLNNLGAKSVYRRRGTLELIGPYEWQPGAVLDFCYKSDSWVIVNGSHAIGAYYGLSRPMSGLPSMDGTASRGSSDDFARGDHVHPSDTSKADLAALATVETGTTASRAYAVGEYFCWNSLLYRVKLAIASGDTITPGTNCETRVATDVGWFPCEYSIVSSRLSDVTGTVQRIGNLIMVALFGTAAEALTSSSEILRIPCVVSSSGFRIVLCANNNFVGARANAGTGSMTGTARIFPNGNVASGAIVTITGLIPIT